MSYSDLIFKENLWQKHDWNRQGPYSFYGVGLTISNHHDILITVFLLWRILKTLRATNSNELVAGISRKCFWWCLCSCRSSLGNCGQFQPRCWPYGTNSSSCAHCHPYDTDKARLLMLGDVVSKPAVRKGKLGFVCEMYHRVLRAVATHFSCEMKIFCRESNVRHSWFTKWVSRERFHKFF